jgi:hypothetical protein
MTHALCMLSMVTMAMRTRLVVTFVRTLLVVLTHVVAGSTPASGTVE